MGFTDRRKAPRAILAAALLVAAVLAVYWPVLGHDFLIYFDDDVYITTNFHVISGLTWPGLRWALTTTRASNWHPLTWLSHMLDSQLFGLEPWGHHMVNLLLHTANVLLLFLFLYRATGALWRSGAVAALFGLHPLHVESVAWVAERKDLLSTCLWLLASLAYLGYLRRPGAARYLLVAFLFALGLMAKPMLVTLPFFFLLMDGWPLGRWLPRTKTKSGHPLPLGRLGRPAFGQRSGHPWPIRVLAEKVPLLFLSAASSAVTYVAQDLGGTVGSLKILPFWLRMANALRSYSLYLIKTFWPTKLSIYYIHPMEDISRSGAALAGLALAAATLLVLSNLRRRPYLAAGWFWYLGTLVPVIGLVQVGIQAMADRYTYLPLTGIFLLMVWGGADTARHWKRGGTALVLALLLSLAALGSLARIQTGWWRDSFSLFQRAVAIDPNNYFAYLNLGIGYAKTGQYFSAEQAYRQALRIVPDWEEAHYQLGLLLLSAGDVAGARKEHRILRDIDPEKAAQLARFIEYAAG